MKTSIGIGLKRRSAPNTDMNWQIVQSGIYEIFRHNNSSLSFEELYRYPISLFRNAYKMVIMRDGQRLYNNLECALRSHLESVLHSKIIPSFPRTNAHPSLDECELFLRSFMDAWNDHVMSWGMIKDLVLYLDKTHVAENNMVGTYEMGLDVFREVVIMPTEHDVEKTLISSILALIDFDRDGLLVQRDIIKSAIKMLLDIPVKCDPCEIWLIKMFKTR
jgi:cullin 3